MEILHLGTRVITTDTVAQNLAKEYPLLGYDRGKRSFYLLSEPFLNIYYQPDEFIINALEAIAMRGFRVVFDDRLSVKNNPKFYAAALSSAKRFLASDAREPVLAPKPFNNTHKPVPWTQRAKPRGLRISGLEIQDE